MFCPRCGAWITANFYCIRCGYLPLWKRPGMVQCRKDENIWTIRTIRPDGSYGYFCAFCQQWCDDCPEKKAELECTKEKDVKQSQS